MDRSCIGNTRRSSRSPGTQFVGTPGPNGITLRLYKANEYVHGRRWHTNAVHINNDVLTQHFIWKTIIFFP